MKTILSVVFFLALAAGLPVRSWSSCSCATVAAPSYNNICSDSVTVNWSIGNTAGSENYTLTLYRCIGCADPVTQGNLVATIATCANKNTNGTFNNTALSNNATYVYQISWLSTSCSSGCCAASSSAVSSVTLAACGTPTRTFTISPTITVTRSPTRTPTISPTPTLANTGTVTYSPTITRTSTPTPSVTRTPTISPTPSRTSTPTTTPSPLPTPVNFTGTFRLPLVDVIPATQGVSATVAVWAYSTAPVGVGNTFTVYFPGNSTLHTGFELPGYDTPYIFMKYTDQFGTFSPQEVTITVGYAEFVEPNGIQVTLPANIGKGQFYVRFDSYFGIKTSSWPTASNTGGTSTLVLGDPLGIKTASAPFYLSPSSGVLDPPGECELKGRVVSSLNTSKGLPGALVFLCSDDSAPMLHPFGPQLTSIEAMGMTTSAYAATTDFDGYYDFKVPCDTLGTSYKLYSLADGKDSAGTQVILPSGSPTPTTYTLTNGASAVTASDLQFALPR